jgi:16S rRNA (uracil1498-N3)-methyltransferase
VPATPPLFLASGDILSGAIVTLGGAEGRHAADVQRLRVGEPVALTDGSGLLGRGVVSAVRRGALDVEVHGVDRLPAPALRLVVVQALAKGGRDEAAVEAMTEVGVDEIVGWAATRSIAKWTERTESRWRSTAAAAAKQSRRAWWPVVSGPATTSEVAGRLSGAACAIVLHESATQPLTAVDLPTSGEVVVVVGPEGGLTEDELVAYHDAGARIVRLGGTVLRSSTAGLVALSVISARVRWR